MVNYIAFKGDSLMVRGNPEVVATAIKKDTSSDNSASILVFDEQTGNQIDLNLSGTLADVRKRYAQSEAVEVISENASKVGRPRLGVVSREVSLLPRHWDWLASQPGSASVTLRRLVEEAVKKNKDVDMIRSAQEVTFRFMSVMAGDLIGYEEALRALYIREEKTFNRFIASWPKDIREQIRYFSQNVFCSFGEGE